MPETGVVTVAAAAVEPCLRDPVCRQTGDRCTYRGCDRTRTTAQGPLPGASSLTVSPASTVDSTCHSLWRTSSHRKVNSPSAACRSSVTLPPRSEEHTSELQSRGHLVCRLLLDK